MAEEQRDLSALGCRLKAAPENGTNVEEMELSGSGPRAGMGRGLCSSQAGTMREFWGRSARQQVRQDLKEEQVHDWEPQFQGLVETMESPLSGRSNTPQRKLSPAEDAKAFLLPCKGMANTCQQPRETKAAQASVGLCMGSEGTDGGFRSENKIGSKKVKEEILDEEGPTLDVHRQCFRQLCYWEAEGPREVCRSLQELCYQWLKPDKHTKERILELVVLEQFLAILPPELRSWLQGHNPETCSQAVALAEDFLLRQQEDKRREEKESFRKIIVNLPEEGATSSFLVIKQESDWDTSSLGDGTAFGQDQRKQPKNTGKLEEQGILSGRTKQDTSCCPGQGETSQRLKECLSEKEEENFINSRGQYEEPEDKAAPPRFIQDERLKTCPDCGKGFVWLSQVVEHQRTHTGERPYACSYCGKSFSSKSYVIKHERIHTGEKPYQCSDCERGFSRKDVLVAHRRTHTGEKPYSCSCCGQNFGTRERLLVHERTHTGEKPYKCPECERCFHDRSSFYAHKRTHRGGKTKKATGLWENA